MDQYNVLVIGGGPAGLAAAIAAHKEHGKVLLVEREGRLGGILKQCIHDGFGLIRFGEKLSGPEYSEKYIEELEQEKIESRCFTFVTNIKKEAAGFQVTFVNQDGVTTVFTKTIILATGCRERTARQVMIHGTRPSGVYTAGTAQYFTNILGQLPTKKCVILGSGDIGLIMARRLTLEGAEVLGVYEAKPEPSGLTRNILQCLKDFEIPLYLSHTVTKVFGEERLTGVEISRVDEKMQPIPGTNQNISCDALILSVGLIPENELAQKLGVELDPRTKGPYCDENFMTSVPGVFSCGNALHVNDLVDYVSESGEIAGRAAAHFDVEKGNRIKLTIGNNLLYLVPQYLHEPSREETVFYFRSRNTMEDVTFSMEANGKKIYQKKYMHLKPPEMERLVLNMTDFNLDPGTEMKVEVQ